MLSLSDIPGIFRRVPCDADINDGATCGNRAVLPVERGGRELSVNNVGSAHIATARSSTCTSSGKAWLNGTGAPSNDLGTSGDYYLDTTNGNVYLKGSGSFDLVGNIYTSQGFVWRGEWSA